MSWADDQQHVAHRLLDDPATLVYDVPDGQDPAAVRAALATAGLTAEEHVDGVRSTVLVADAAPSGATGHDVRELARRAIAGASIDLEGHGRMAGTVHFRDEEQGDPGA